MSLILPLDNGSISDFCRNRHQRCFPLWWIGLGLLVLLTSCNSKKYLREDQSFLRDNKIKIKSRNPIPNKSDLYENLLLRYRQKHTRTVAGIPRHTFYYRYQERLAKNPDRKKWSEERLIKNRPVIYDSLQAFQTTEDFEKYLSLRGYRFSYVTFRAKTADKETTVYYLVDPGPRMYIDSFLILAGDSAIQQIVEADPDKPFIQHGSPLDIQLYNQERQRIVKILQNEGYATFDENYVSPLHVDTSQGYVKAIMRLFNPTDSTFHQQFYVGDVHIYPDYEIVKTTGYHDTIVRQIHYHLPDSNIFTLKPEAIERNLFLSPGDLSRRDNLSRTIKGLGRMDLIKFVTPVTTIDTTDVVPPSIDYFLYLTRNKKIDFLATTELTYSTIAGIERRSLAGMNFNVNYKDRNTYRGAEVLNINLETGFEFNFKRNVEDPDNNLLNTLNIGAGTNLSFPRFIDPLRLYSMIGHSNKEEPATGFFNRLHQQLNEDASTRFSIGYNYVTIRDLYEYHAFNTNLSYDIQPDPFRKLTIDRFGFDLFVPDAKPAFQEILDKNRFQRESFGKQLFTGVFFRNYLAEINSRNRPKTGYFKVFHSFELSGLEVYFLNSVFSKHDAFVLGPKNDPDAGIKFSHFAKGELDFRYYRDFSRNTQFAFKFNTGIATPYGPFTLQVPYLKQFFVGGALSNRAWQIRELGPGSFQDTAQIDPNLPFYQTGDFKIDMSIELRFKLFWYFKGALFMDAANIWTLNDQSRDEANLSADFYKEFGIGYGWGIRLDVQFFILRFDLGYKLYNPYPINNSRLLKHKLGDIIRDAEPQIAVGLPF